MTDNWLVVETLAPGARTVIADGGKIKNWASLTRARTHGSTVSTRMSSVVDACVASGAEQHEAVTARSGESFEIRAVPVLAALDVVHAVHLWVGRHSDELPARRVVVAWHWDVDDGATYHGTHSVEEHILRIPEDERRSRRSAMDNFQHIVRFDDRAGYSTLVSDTTNDSAWQGTIVMRAVDGTLHHLQMAARTDGRARIARGLFHDISDVDPPQVPVDNAALRMVAAATGIGTGAIDLNSAIIYEWFSTPIEPLARWQRDNPEIEPSDKRLLAAACQRLETTGESEKLVIRVRFDTGSDWISTEVEIIAISSDRAPQGLIQVSPLP